MKHEYTVNWTTSRAFRHPFPVSPPPPPKRWRGGGSVGGHIGKNYFPKCVEVECAMSKSGVAKRSQWQSVTGEIWLWQNVEWQNFWIPL